MRRVPDLRQAVCSPRNPRGRHPGYGTLTAPGKNYAQFPDRQSFRIHLEDLRRPDVRERLAAIWTDPVSLDPARRSARVTRAIAERLAAVSKALERDGHDPEQMAMFLMRCLFTMFAEDVELLPKESFRDLLARCEADPSRLPHMVGQLWEAMDKADFVFALKTRVRRFNGAFFKSRTVLPLGRAELRRAASHDWRNVDPSISGTLPEQALNARERRRLGGRPAEKCASNTSRSERRQRAIATMAIAGGSRTATAVGISR